MANKLSLQLAYPILIIIILGKQSQESPKNLGKLVIHYFLPKLLVTYGSVRYKKTASTRVIFLLRSF